MFRLIRVLGLRNTVILVVFVFAVALVYDSFFAPKPPAYTRPAGYWVKTTCATEGRDCDEYGAVLLWDDVQKTSSSFVRYPEAVPCIATEPTVTGGAAYWWIDCGLWQGKELPVIEGFVPEENLLFGAWQESAVIHE